MNKQNIDHEKLLFLYSCALEDGDFATIQDILAQAEQDAELMAQLREIEALAAHSRVRGIGETGLDYFRTPEELRAKQEHSFRAHIAIAKRTDKALIIHDRDAHEDILRVLKEEGAPEKVIFHCYSFESTHRDIKI